MKQKSSINQGKGRVGRSAALLLMFFLLQIGVFAQNRRTDFPRIEPDPKALEYYQLGRQSGGFTWEQLAEISLWASGDVSLSNIDKILSAVTALNNSADLPPHGKERAEFILAFLHSNILRSYSLHQTRVDTVFTNGVFNCVSSAALYIILCESAGVKTSGVVTKEHAFVIVHIDGENIDVETTNRFGFDPGNRKEFHDQFGRLTGFSYVPAQNYRDRQTVTNIELISLIFSNRVAEQERRNRFADSVPLAVDRAALLYGDSLSVMDAISASTLFVDPRKELMDRLANYGTSLLRANREEDSIIWAGAISSKYPDNERWQEFVYAAINNKIARFIRERKIIESRDFLENNKIFLSQENYLRLHSLVRGNMATYYHNRFATEWNRRNYDEAERILNEGLAEFPDDRQLLNNKDAVERYKSR